MTAHLALLSGMNHAMASIACPGVGGGGRRCAVIILTIVYLAFIEAYHKYSEATLITERSTQGKEFAKIGAQMQAHMSAQ